MKILHRVKLALARVGGSAGPPLSGGAAGTQIGLGQIEAAEQQEFPPEEFAPEQNGESES